MSGELPEPMEAEFDTVADWTARVAVALGPQYSIVAGCRGSGSPAALDWLVDRLEVGPGELVLDCGAGIGGPAAYLAERIAARPVLFDPALGACRAARRLFGLPAVVADAAAAPFGTDRFAAAWCLGVLCTTGQQEQVLREARRAVRPGGRLGLLVFLATRDPLPEQPDGNQFPSDEHVRQLLHDTGWTLLEAVGASELPSAPAEWRQREDEIDAELERRYGDRPESQVAAEQSAIIGRLLGSGDLVARLMIAR